MRVSDFTDASGRIHSLDGLRAFSIIVVCLGHLKGTVGSPDVLQYFHSPGSRFFFIISSFLITWMLLRELEINKRVNYARFFRDRIFRIFPAFYAYIIIGAILVSLGWVQINPGDLLHAATFTMNYHDDRAWYFNSTWSLGYQEQFYLIWPFLLVFLGRKNMPLFLVLTILMVPAVRAVMWYQFDASPTAMMRNFHNVVDTLAMGCLLASGCFNGTLKRVNGRWLRVSLWGLSAGLFLGAFGLYKLDLGAFYIFGQSIANIATVLVLYLCLTTHGGFVHKMLNNRVAIYIGTLSYSIYLWQAPFLDSYQTGPLQSYPWNVFLTIIAALGSYYLIEMPAMRLKKKVRFTELVKTPFFFIRQSEVKAAGAAHTRLEPKS